LIIFNNGEVTDVSAWPPNDIYAIKNVCTENLQLRKITWVRNDINKASDSAFTVNVRYVSLGFCTKLLFFFANSSTTCASLSLSIKEARWRYVGLLLRFLALLFRLLPEKLFSELLFWKFTSLITSAAVI